MRLTPEYCSDTSEEVMEGVHTAERLSSSSHSIWVPTSRSMPRMTSTSVMRGTLDSTQGSGVNRVATSCLVTAFLAPAGVTSPWSGFAAGDLPHRPGRGRPVVGQVGGEVVAQVVGRIGERADVVGSHSRPSYGIPRPAMRPRRAARSSPGLRP